MNIKKFEEHSEEEYKKIEVRVKDLIKFLEKFDPETQVYLDKDGWQGQDVEDSINGLIDDSPITHGNSDYLIINN